MIKRISRIFFVFTALIGLSMGGLLLWTTSQTGSAWISAKVRDTAQKEIGLIITFSKIDLAFFPPRLVLRDLSASDLKNRINAVVEEVELAPDALALLQGELKVEEIYLGSPMCSISLETPDIDELLTRLSKRDAKSSALKNLDLSSIPPFDAIAVSDGKFNVVIKDPARFGSGDLAVERVNFDITGKDRKIEIRSLIEGAHLNWVKGEKTINETLSKLEFRSAISENAVDIRSISLEAGGAKLRGRDAHIPIPMWPSGPDVADISFDVPLEIFGRLPLELPPMKGTASFTGQASIQKHIGEAPTISAKGEVALKNGWVDEFVIGDLKGLIALRPQGISFSQVDLKTAQGHLALNGSVAFDDKLSVDVKAKLKGIELARLLENVTFDGAQVTQHITGTIKTKGTLKPFRLNGGVKLGVTDLTVLSDGFRKPGNDVLLYLPKSTVRGQFGITDKRFTAKNIDARTGDSKVSVDLLFNFGPGGWRIIARSDQIDLDDVKQIAGFDVAGRGKVTCRITDLTYGNPQIVGSASFKNMSFAGFDFENITTGVRFDGTNLVFDGLTVRSNRSLYSTRELNLDFGAPGGLHVETKVDAEHMDIEELAKTLHVDTKPYGSPSGTLFGRVAIDYHQHPHSFRIESRLTHDELKLFGENFGSEDLSFVWQDGQLTVDRLGLRKKGGLISLTGAVMADDSINFMGVAGNVNVATIDNPAIKNLGINAKAQIFAFIDGTLSHPTGKIDFRLSQARRGKKKYGPSHLEAKLDGDVVVGRGTLGGRLFTLEYGRLDLSSNEFELEVFSDGVDLIDLLEVDTKGRQATLNITGEAYLSGRLSDKPKLSGEARLNWVEFTLDDFKFKNQERLLITARNDRFRLNRTRFTGDDTIFDLSGRADLEQMNFAINGMVDLKPVSRLVKSLRNAEGVLSFEGRVSGPWGDPRFRGQAEIENGGINVKGFPHRIENINGRVVMGPKIIKFNNFTAQMAGGDLDMQGHINIRGFEIENYVFNANVDGADLNIMEDLSFRASTINSGIWLRSDGDRGLPTVTGDVKISHLRYTQDLKAVQISDLSVNRLTGTRTRTRKPKIYDEKKDIFAFDVRLHGEEQDDLVVRNNIVDAGLHIDDREEPLRFVGTNQTYGFLGRVLGTGGRIRYAGKSFDVRYAAVSFKDKLRPDNPDFRITADGEIRDWKITITAEGTVEDYSVTLISQPYLSQEDIVLLLLTGMTKAELAQVDSRGLGGTITPFLDFGGDLIPVEIRLYNEYSEKAGTDTTRVSVEKQITEDIWAVISSSLGQEREIKANVEYKLSDNFSILIDFDNESQLGNLGVDLKYRLEF